MNKPNLKGVTPENTVGILMLVIALVNAVLQMFGYHTLPIKESDVSETVSAVFLILTTLYNMYKNRNFTTASQKAQEITNAIKSGELLISDVDNILRNCKNRNRSTWKGGTSL